MTNIHEYQRYQFVAITSAEEKVQKFLFKTFPVAEDVQIYQVMNKSMSTQDIFRFYDLCCSHRSGVKIGYIIETPYCVKWAYNFIGIQRKNNKHKELRLLFSIPHLNIYALNSDTVILASRTETQLEASLLKTS